MYTNEQIRGAILRAADRIERTPDSYRFSMRDVPGDDGCGTQACMWGWIGFELGMRGACNAEVADACGFSASDSQLGIAATGHLYDFCANQLNAKGVPANLRAYANKHFPAVAPPPIRPTIPEDRQPVRWDQCAWRPASTRA